MFCKRILILQQSNSRFAERKKELCGMVKLVNNGNGTDTQITTFIANADVAMPGEWWLLLAFGRQCYAYKLSTLNNDSVNMPTQQLDNVCCLLVKREDACYEVARAYVGNGAMCDSLCRNMAYLVEQGSNAQQKVLNGTANAINTPNLCNMEQVKSESFVQTSTEVASDATAYEQFVASTANFYPQVDIQQLHHNAASRYKCVHDYSAAFDRFYAAGGGNDYYQAVKQQIAHVFLHFPPYYPLMRRYNHSFFVRIDFPNSDKFFVLGVLTQEGNVKYICYGLPADVDDIGDKDFVFVQSNPPFWMLFQDANSGQISALTETV